MSYKTILVHVDESRHLRSRVDIASKIAIAESAHLVGAATTGITRYIVEGSGMPFDPGIQPFAESLRKRADRALDAFDEMAKSVGVLSYEKRLSSDEMADDLSLHARYCDLVVVGQDDLDDPSPATLPGFPEFIALNSGSPTLVVPYAGTFQTVGERVLVAWNASSHAMHALRGAMPLLRRARIVDVVVYNAKARKHVFGEEPGADIALYLARHGVKVNVMQEEIDKEIDIGNALLSHAAERSSDLLVMGCYGHSRFREMLLGGATRVVLESMTVPVLLAH